MSEREDLKAWRRRNELRQGSRAQPIPKKRRFPEELDWLTGPNGYCICDSIGGDDCPCSCHDL